MAYEKLYRRRSRGEDPPLPPKFIYYCRYLDKKLSKNSSIDFPIPEHHITDYQVPLDRVNCFQSLRRSKQGRVRQYGRGSYEDEIAFYELMTEVCVCLSCLVLAEQINFVEQPCQSNIGDKFYRLGETETW